MLDATTEVGGLKEKLTVLVLPVARTLRTHSPRYPV